MKLKYNNNISHIFNVKHMDYKNINVILQRWNGCDTHHSRCTNIFNAINEALENNININLKYLHSYIYKLLNDINRHYYRTNHDACMIQNYEVIKKVMGNILNIPTFFSYGVNDYPDTKSIMRELLLFPTYDSCYDNVILPEPLKFNDNDQVFLACIERLNSNYYENNHIANFVIKNTNMTPNVIAQLCSCKNEMLSKFVAGILDKATDISDKDLLGIACTSLPFTKLIIQSLVSRNIKIKNEHINSVLSDGSAESIDFIIDLAKSQGEFVLTKEHYKILLTSQTLVNDEIDRRQTCVINKIVHKLNSNYELHLKKCDNNYTTDKMMILIKHGFVPDREDIILSIEHKKEMPMIEKFNVQLDNDFLKLCQDNNFYPKYDFKCISPGLFELQSLCLNKNLPKIRAFLKKNNTIVPDNICMENACNIIRNEKTIDLLINAGGVINKKCLTNYLHIVRDPQMSLLVNNFMNNIPK